MIDYMQGRHATFLEKKLDRQQYNDKELISIKTPLHLPYYTSSTEYERAYGSVMVNGVTYEYVKRRVHQDTLELLCLPDKGKMELQTAENDFFKMSVDGTSSQQQKKSVNIKLSLPDYCQEWNVPASVFEIQVRNKYFLSSTSFDKADYSSKDGPPPKLYC